MNMAQTSPFQNEAQHPLQGYVERFRALQHYSDSKDDLIKELITGWSQAATELALENDQLKKSVDNLQLDLENAVQSRRELQSRLRNSEREIDRFMHDNDGLKNRNPYVMVLIDGDGLIFQDHWIKLGIEGGKKAAYALRAAILESFDNNDVEVMAKVVANVSGLGKALQREGSLHSEATLRDFTLGFTQAKAAFDFVDVGYGKERADSKIKEMTRWNLRSHNCKQVFLGVSHDAGYAPFLDEILQDEDTRRRVTLLEGFPTVRELRATGVNIDTDLTATIFRTDNIVANPSNGYSRGYTRREESSTTSSSPSLRSASPPAMPVLPSNGSWAVVTGGASPPPKLTTPLANRIPAPAKTTKEEPPKWSPGPRGLDEPVYATADALEAIKNRDKNDKYCNNFYLRGNCPKRYNGCYFNHDAKPTAEELNALKLLTRTNPCGAGQDCYIEDCIYGHHCPSVKDGICPHPYCKFPKDLHPPGTRFANKKIDYN